MRSKREKNGNVMSLIILNFTLSLAAVLCILSASEAQARLIQESVRVDFTTMDDDKDSEDGVRLWIEQGNNRVSAVVDVGRGQTWKDHRPVYPIYIPLLGGMYESSQLRLVVQKYPTDKGWRFNVQAGSLAPFRVPVLVLPKTGRIILDGPHQTVAFPLVP